MTAPPPPPPGGYPPPQGYPGYPPPPPPPAWRLPKEAYTPWSARLLAFLIDWTPIWLALIVPVIGLLIAGDTECIDSMYGSGGGYCSTPESDLWLSVQALTFLLAAVYFFWNFCYRQGKTGQSIGKSVLKFKVISEKPGNPSASGGHSCAKSPTTSTNSSATSAICFRCGTTSVRRSPTSS